FFVEVFFRIALRGPGVLTFTHRTPAAGLDPTEGDASGRHRPARCPDPRARVVSVSRGSDPRDPRNDMKVMKHDPETPPLSAPGDQSRRASVAGMDTPTRSCSPGGLWDDSCLRTPDQGPRDHVPGPGPPRRVGLAGNGQGALCRSGPDRGSGQGGE